MYMLPVTLGAGFMTIGFAVRCYMAHVGETFSMGIYIVQTLVSEDCRVDTPGKC